MSAPSSAAKSTAAPSASASASGIKRKAEQQSVDEEKNEATVKRPAFAAAAGGSSLKSEDAVVKKEGGESIKSDPDAAVADDDDDAFVPFNQSSHLAGLPRDPSTGHILCPFLDTVNRSLLDFDFEKLCSVSLHNQNVYACLVCGKFFQGRGKNSYAYAHSLEEHEGDSSKHGHHIFLNLGTEEIWCLPEGYQVFDASLDDIKYNLRPKFSRGQLEQMDRNTAFVHALDGTDYLPGLMGLNNITALSEKVSREGRQQTGTDWLNAIVQALNFISGWRNFFIFERDRLADISKAKMIKSSAAPSSAAASTSSSAAASKPTSALLPSKPDLVLKYGELLSKMWNPRSFKGHVSPHELLQCISTLSQKTYTIGKPADTIKVLSWMLHEMHRELGGTRKKGSIVTKTFQGEIKIVTTMTEDDDETTAAAEASSQQRNDSMDVVDEKESDPKPTRKAPKTKTTTEYKPFLYLSLTLPQTPLFKDALTADKAIIPQVPLHDLLKKFDGSTIETSIDPVSKKEVHKTYRITKLPSHLLIHFQRFTENNWFWEKNPTLVSFPLENLEMGPYTKTDEASDAPNATAAAVGGSSAGDKLTEESIRGMSVSELKKNLAKRKVKVEHIVEKDELVKLLIDSQTSAPPPPTTRFNLISNLVHEGKPSSRHLGGGKYKTYVLHKASKTWYEVEDLHVSTSETMPQLVALSEAYIQVYEMQQPSSSKQ